MISTLESAIIRLYLRLAGGELMYLKRAIEDKLKETMKHYPVILVTGPRQVGKTTLLKEISKGTHQYITMDDLIQRQLLEEDPNLFFKKQ